MTPIQLVYICWLCVETLFCYVYIVETRNRTLEETAAIFDGEDATHTIAQQAVTKLMKPLDTLEEKEKSSMGGSEHQSEGTDVHPIIQVV